MVRAFGVAWQACKDLFDEFFLLLVVNVLWSLISLPMLVICWLLLTNGYLIEALVVSALAIVPLAPASAALCWMANQVRQGIVSSSRQFFGAMRRHARASWRVLGLWQLGLLLIIVDIWFYSAFGDLIGATLTIFWLYMLAIWVALALYLTPLLVLTEGGARATWRSAAAMTFGRPLFTLTLTVLVVVMLVLSLLVPLLLTLVAASLLALVGVRATQRLLDEAEAAREASETAQTGVGREQTGRGRRGQVRPRD